MISDDIIKKIKFVFAGDNKDLKKTLDETNKAAASLSKNFDLGKQSAVLDKFIKNLGGTSKELTKSMQGLQKGFKDIAEKDFDKFTKKVQGAYKSLQETQKKIETSQRAGDATELQRLQRIQKHQQSNLSSNMQNANSAAAAGGGKGGAPTAAGMFGQIGSIGAAMGTGYAAVRSLSLLPNFAKSAGEMSLNNQSQLAGLARNNFQRYYSGDVSQEMVLGRNNGAAQTEVINALEAGASSRMIGSGISGGLKGAYNKATSSFTSLHPMGFAYNAVAGALSGGQEQYATDTAKDYQSLINKKIDNSKDPLYMQNILSNAQGRYGMQSAFEASDTAYGSFLGKLKGTRMSESDMQNFGMQNRESLGNAGAMDLIGAQGRMRNTTGMNMDLSNQLLQATSLNGSGNGTAEEKTVKMFSEAFNRGITDSGLLEGILRGSAALAQSFNSKVDMSKMTGDISSMANVMGGDARSTQGATSAASAFQGMFEGSDQFAMYKTNFTAKLTQNMKDPRAQKFVFNTLQGMAPEQLEQLGNNEAIKKSFMSMGMSEEQWNDTVKQAGNFKSGIANMNSTTRDAKAMIAETAKRTGRSEESVALDMLPGMGALAGAKGNEKFTTALGMNVLGIKPTDATNAFTSAANAQSQTKAGVATGLLSDRGNAFGQEVMDNSNVAAGDINAGAVSQEYSKKQSGGSFGLGGSVNGLIAALENFATALTTDRAPASTSWTAPAKGKE